MQRSNALFGLTHPLVAFELEGLGHDANGQHTQLTRSLRDDRSRACARAATHASGDKAHVCASQMIDDFLDGFFGGGGTNRRAGPSAQTLGRFDTHLDARGGLGLLQRLCIGVRHHEFDALKLLVNHIVDRIAPCPADAKHRNPGLQLFASVIHDQIQCHVLSACHF